MLVQFVQRGPVQSGPQQIFGLEGQYADLDGADLDAALKSGMVRKVDDQAAAEEPAAETARGRKKANS
jgi:hypothetical protein